MWRAQSAGNGPGGIVIQIYYHNLMHYLCRYGDGIFFGAKFIVNTRYTVITTVQNSRKKCDMAIVVFKAFNIGNCIYKSRKTAICRSYGYFK